MTKCYICNAEIDTSNKFIVSYWKAIRFPVCESHSDEEIKQQKMQDAYECQKIDADCNDCKHFKRGKRIMINMDNGGKRGSDSFHGHCLKFDRPTIANVNFATGYECFEHRKD